MKLASKVKVGTLALMFAGALCGCNKEPQYPSRVPSTAPSSPAAAEPKTMTPETNAPAMPVIPVAPLITNEPMPTVPTLPQTPGYK